MLYNWLTAVHVAATIAWVGGILVVVVTTTSFKAPTQAGEQYQRRELYVRIRRWDQRVTTPAMLAVWAFGLGLVVTGQWLSQNWLLLKVGLVLVLTGIHSTLSGDLAKLALGKIPSGLARARFFAAVIGALVVLVVFLVVFKPF